MNQSLVYQRLVWLRLVIRGLAIEHPQEIGPTLEIIAAEVRTTMELYNQERGEIPPESGATYPCIRVN